MPPTRFLSRPGGRIAYELSGHGPLVVCAPGMGDVAFVYRFLARSLTADGSTVAVMDLRGHGQSDATFDRYDDVAVGGDMLALVRELGGGPAVLVGNSMSAGAAVWAAAEAPDLVSGLVLIGPFVRNTPLGAGARLAFRLALLRPWGPAVWTRYHRSLFREGAPPDMVEHTSRIRESLRRPGHWRAFAKTTRTTHAPAEARLSEVRARALVIMGSADPDFPDPAAEAAFVADRLGARVEMIPGAGHYPQAECPERVVPVVARFVAEGAGLRAQG